MKKNHLFVVLAIALVGFQSMKADNAASTQALTMAVGGSALIKVTRGTNAEAVGTTVALSLGGPAIAGESVDSVFENTSTRLRMTSYVAGSATRSISAVLTGADAAAWRTSNTRLQISLETPSNPTAFRNYNPFANGLQGLKTLADNTGVKGAQPLVTGIKTAWSGTGDLDGYVIKYVFSAVDQYIVAQPVTSATVTFTISE